MAVPLFNKKMIDIMELTTTRLKNAIWRRMRMAAFQANAFKRYVELRGDSNYNLALLEKGFKPQVVDSSDDTVILTRICNSYNKSKQVQKTENPVYSPSNEWVPIYEKPYREVMQALSSGDIEKLSVIYRNFWRNSTSAGLIGFPVDSMEKSYFSGGIWLPDKLLAMNDGVHRYNLWKNLTNNRYSPSALESPLIGNPFGYYFDGHFVKCGSDYLHYYASTIGGLMTSSAGAKAALELGGGYGGMGYYFMRDNQDATYVDVDLPENMALTAYYLLKSFPDREFLLYGEADLESVDIAAYSGVILPSFAIRQLPSKFADVVFNSYSLAEMSREAIDEYIAQMGRINKDDGYFLHVNHNKNSVVTGDNFGIENYSYRLEYKRPALWNFAMNPAMDEIEYLYARSCK